MLLSDLSVIARGGQVYVTRNLSDFSITAAEDFILMYLFGHSETNQDSIANYFFLDKGTIARSLAKLETKGYIEREINSENQREKVIKLTEKAIHLKESLDRLLSNWNALMYDGLTKEEVESFERTAKKIASNITARL